MPAMQKVCMLGASDRERLGCTVHQVRETREFRDSISYRFHRVDSRHHHLLCLFEIALLAIDVIDIICTL